MIKLNDVVKCQPNGNLTCPFVGTVERIYERTVMVTVTEHHPNDHWKLMELMGRVIVGLDKVELHDLQLEPVRSQAQ
ncbi:hypothetical protein [Secundilactobacillus folii]|uniref:DUF2187 domain-containing protein n=1 Tax=Secundilactobacillus folii TaxID=2678357 RepID=A0A7X3C495_9LACO|nr:hypothetical protein [Secundilactobacillus folii]MTV83327.1 hypothetical protein [Secundilactobacillus folii]